MANGPERIRIVHVIATPLSLGLLKEQIGYAPRRRDFDLHMVANPDERLEEFGKEFEVPTHGIPISRTITPWQDVETVFVLRGLLRRLRPHVVVGHFSKAGLVAMLAGRLARVPACVYHNYGMALFSSGGRKRWVLKQAERFTCRLAHRVLCVSHTVRAAVVEEGICPAAKIKTFLYGSHAGVDAGHKFDPGRHDAASKAAVRAKYGIPPDALVVGHAGRILPLKGVPELVTAWQSLRVEFPDAHLLFIGDHDPRERVPGPIEEAMRADPRVHVTGWIRDVVPPFSILDLFVLPSHHEGLPTVSLEASAMGLPVVTTRVMGNIDSVEDGVTGTIVPVRDPAALAEAMRKYMRDPALRAEHGRAGRERVLRDFRPEPILEATYEEYVSLLREKGALPRPA
jgi:glycosyltransferase involved in cell wall biosynthesis